MGTRIATADMVSPGALTVTKPAVDKVDIAKKLANPIANMISMPLQYEFSRALEEIKADLSKLYYFSR